MTIQVLTRRQYALNSIAACAIDTGTLGVFTSENPLKPSLPSASAAGFISVNGIDNDQLYGGAGDDTYQFDAAWGKDVITDSDGKGTITIGGEPLGTAKGGGKTNVWVTELGAGSGQYVGMAVFDDASSKTGKKLIITKGTDTSNTIIINNFDLAQATGGQGYLGIKLDKTQHIAITQGSGTAQGASTPNVYADRYFNTSSLQGKSTQFNEGTGTSFTVSLAVGAKAGGAVHFTMNSVAACAVSTGALGIFASENSSNRSLPSAGTHTLFTAAHSVCVTRFNSGDTTNRSCPKRCAQPRRGCRWVGDVMGERITISSVAACALNTGVSAIFSSKNAVCKRSVRARARVQRAYTCAQVHKPPSHRDCV